MGDQDVPGAAQQCDGADSRFAGLLLGGFMMQLVDQTDSAQGTALVPGRLPALTSAPLRQGGTRLQLIAGPLGGGTSMPGNGGYRLEERLRPGERGQLLLVVQVGAVLLCCPDR